MRERLTILLLCAGLGLGVGADAHALAYRVISSGDAASLGGLGLGDADLAHYDANYGVGTLHFDANLFAANENIDAVHVLDNGNIVLSTTTDATLGGLSFGDDDLAEYDPNTGLATLLFDGGALFAQSNEDVDAVFVRDNGNILLSTSGAATLGGLGFDDEDVVEFDPNTGIATLFFDGSAFYTDNEDTDAFHLLDNGNLVLSTTNDAILGGLAFGAGDLVEWDPGTNTASLYFDGALFVDAENIDAAFVPEPESATTLALGLLALGLLRRPRRRRAAS